jgi:Putative zinc-finger
MISCKEASRLASHQLERKLGFFERVQLKVHLAYCAGCRRMEKQFHFLRNASTSWLNHSD